MSAVSLPPVPATAPDHEWIAELPKVCLHDHLDGGLRVETVLDLAEQAGHELPAQDAAALAQWFSESADSGSLVRYLETFEHTVAVMQTTEALHRVAREHVLDLAADGVVYAEVRWAPEQHGRGGLSLDQAVEAVAAGLQEGEEQAAARGQHLSVRQILCAMRHQDRALEVARTVDRYRGWGVVAFDLAGPEEGFPASGAAEALDWCAQHLVPVTLHAGEAAGVDSVRDALVAGRALRLGHGVRILEDVTRTGSEKDLAENVARLPGACAEAGWGLGEQYCLGETAAWVRDRQIPLETCPCSNLQTAAAPAVSAVGTTDAQDPRRAQTYREHPVDLLRRLGFTVTVNPDNRLMSGTSMTHEFACLAQEFGYGPEDFFELTMNAALAAFLPLEQKNALVDRVVAGYSDSPVVGA